MTVIRNAFRSVYRRLFRTVLVSILLGLCVAILISTIAGVRTGQSGTQALVVEVETSTAALVTELETSTTALITDVETSTAALVADIEESTPALVAEVEASSAALIADLETSSAALVADVTASTEAIVAQVETSAEDTIALTEILSRMITVFTRPPPLNETNVNDIAALNNVSVVVPQYNGRVGGAGDPRSRDYDYMVRGVPLDAALIDNYPVLPSLISDGRALDETDGMAIMINQDLITVFNAGVGDIVNLEGTDFTIVGIFHSTSVQDQRLIYMSLDNAQTLFTVGDRVSAIQLYATSEIEVDTVAADIEALNSAWIVRTSEDQQTGGIGQSIVLTQEEQIAIILDQAEQQIEAIEANAAAQIATLRSGTDAQIATAQNSAATQIATLQSAAEAQLAEAQADANEQITTAQYNAEIQLASMQGDLDNINRLGYQIIAVAGAAGLLMIFGIMFYTVRERGREIGTLKALGFSNMYVLKRFLLEGLFIGLLGGLIGIGLGVATSSFLVPKLLSLESAVRVTLGPEYLLIGLGAAALLGAVGSLYPAWRASHVSPMMALKQD